MRVMKTVSQVLAFKRQGKAEPMQLAVLRLFWQAHLGAEGTARGDFPQ